ncbi:MAG: hypothetical protein ACQETH_00630 [Candidatus Rifleibacteriota bacterium]
MKKCLFIVMISLFCSVVFEGSAEENNFKRIFSLNYHKSMFEAQRSNVLLKIPLGEADSEIGASEQDEERYTEGVPFAFRSINEKVWILDSANNQLKLFSPDTGLKKNISIASYGKVIKDFAFAPDGSFWLFAPIEGYIYKIDSEGKQKTVIEGFFDAASLETSGKNLLVDMPMMASILSFDESDTLKKQIPYGKGLSPVYGIGNKLLGLNLKKRNATLNLRIVASPPQDLQLAEFPLEIKDSKVNYAGGEIIGKDSAGNIYLNLVACHSENGAIYRDRLYRCSPSGRVLSFSDIIRVPCLAPDLPRKQVVTPEGKILTFYLEPGKYVLATYDL